MGANLEERIAPEHKDSFGTRSLAQNDKIYWTCDQNGREHRSMGTRGTTKENTGTKSGGTGVKWRSG